MVPGSELHQSVHNIVQRVHSQRTAATASQTTTATAAAAETKVFQPRCSTKVLFVRCEQELVGPEPEQCQRVLDQREEEETRQLRRGMVSGRVRGVAQRV